MVASSQYQKHGFTIIELLIGIFIISLVIFGVVSMINVANNHVNKIRQETIAINLTREGMEAMYTRRNTNRLQHSAEKDKYWLCIDDNCSGRFLPDNGDYYILKHDVHGNGYFVPQGSTNSLQEDNIFKLGDSDFITTKPTGGEYYRAIIPLGLYQKDVNMTGGNSLNSSCQGSGSTYNKLSFDGTPTPGPDSCGDDTPKEFLFCSKVEYQGLGAANGNVELCGSLTNYEE